MGDSSSSGTRTPAPEEGPRALRVLVIAGDWRLREAVQGVLQRTHEIELVSAASDPAEAAAAWQGGSLDAVLIGSNGPPAEALASCRAALAVWPDIPILLLSERPTAQLTYLALREGFSLLAVDESAEGLLPSAVRLVAASSLLARGDLVVESVRRVLKREFSSPADWYALTPRELDVLGDVAEGLSNKQIAAHLGVTPQAVKNHVGRILGKLGVENRTAAASVARRERLVPSEHT